MNLTGLHFTHDVWHVLPWTRKNFKCLEHLQDLCRPVNSPSSARRLQVLLAFSRSPSFMKFSPCFSEFLYSMLMAHLFQKCVDISFNFCTINLYCFPGAASKSQLPMFLLNCACVCLLFSKWRQSKHKAIALTNQTTTNEVR